jgi:hypothetical protein
MRTRMKRFKKRENFSYKCVLELNLATVNGLGEPTVKIVVPYYTYLLAFVQSVSVPRLAEEDNRLPGRGLRFPGGGHRHR